MTSLSSKLFRSSMTDCSIQNVQFHMCVLETIPYFESLFKYEKEKTEIELPISVSENTVHLFKQWLYEQPINTVLFSVDTLVDVFKLSDSLVIDFYKKILYLINRWIKELNDKEKIEAYLC